MVRFDGYWNPKLPYLDQVTFKFIGDASAQITALKAGDIDVLGWISAPESAAELSKDKRFKVYAGTTTGEVIMPTNNKAKSFDNQLVLHAMAYAIDPSIATEVRHLNLRVETSSELTRGMVVMDLLGFTGAEPNARVVAAADRDRFVAMLHAALS